MQRAPQGLRTLLGAVITVWGALLAALSEPPRMGGRR